MFEVFLLSILSIGFSAAIYFLLWLVAHFNKNRAVGTGIAKPRVKPQSHQIPFQGMTAFFILFPVAIELVLLSQGEFLVQSEFQPESIYVGVFLLIALLCYLTVVKRPAVNSK